MGEGFRDGIFGGCAFGGAQIPLLLLYYVSFTSYSKNPSLLLIFPAKRASTSTGLLPDLVSKYVSAAVTALEHVSEPGAPRLSFSFFYRLV